MAGLIAARHIPVILCACERLLQLHDRWLIYTFRMTGGHPHERLIIVPQHRIYPMRHGYSDEDVVRFQSWYESGRLCVFMDASLYRRFVHPIVDLHRGKLVLCSSPRIKTKLEE